ncbi:PIN domain-containing protein [Candidatus Berkelbacteria bacterium]|nr:PIN domain-containing protein [Candidatus Berkelbacteria bacterium]
MLRVFLDTNVIQDILVGRSGVSGSLAVLKEIKENNVKASVSALSIPIIWYLNRKLTGQRQKLRELISYFSIVSLSSAMIQSVLKLPRFGDLEDELQYLCAKSARAQYLVTRNVNDFPIKDIAVVTPEEFLNQLK